MEQELTGLFTGDFHKLRVFQNDTMRDILDIISSPGGVPTIVQAGSGIAVQEVSNKHFVISNIAPGTQGDAGSDGAVQSVYINDGAGVEQTFTASQVQGLRFSGALGQLANGTLTVSGLRGADGQDASTPQDGQDGAPAAMQKITVAGQTFTSYTLSEVVFSCATAQLQDGRGG